MYLFCTTPDLPSYVEPLEDCLRLCLIPTLTGQTSVSNTIRSLLSLPARLGGLGIFDPTFMAESQYHNSVYMYILTPLISSLCSQDSSVPMSSILDEIRARKREVGSNNYNHTKNITSNFKADPSLKHCLEVTEEKGASTWLNALPIQEHGFALHKGDFRDAICLRYGWSPPHLPNHRVCGTALTVDHALNCKCGGFVSIRHNEVRDLTAKLLTETCSDVRVEPPLQPLNGEVLSGGSAVKDDNARVDIAATGFWSSRQRAFFDVHVFNPFSVTYKKSTLKACHRRNELEKRHCYDERIRLVEHGSFTPLTFTVGGGIGPAASIFYKRLASILSKRNSKPYSMVLNWMRCLLSFSLLRSSILCLRGAR